MAIINIFLGYRSFSGKLVSKHIRYYCNHWPDIKNEHIFTNKQKILNIVTYCKKFDKNFYRLEDCILDTQSLQVLFTVQH